MVIGVGAIGLITIGNLRGLREAGNIFAIPTYLFVFSALLMIARRHRSGSSSWARATATGAAHRPGRGHAPAARRSSCCSRAFAAGAVALTGTEAIATGVPAFKPPESKNAASTLGYMAALLAVLFVGITFLAVSFGITHVEVPSQTVISQVARAVYGDGVMFYLFQAFTALLLFLAANT